MSEAADVNRITENIPEYKQHTGIRQENNH